MVNNVQDLRGLWLSGMQGSCEEKKMAQVGAKYHLRLKNIHSAPEPPTIACIYSG